jgi:hypothetical protein
MLQIKLLKTDTELKKVCLGTTQAVAIAGHGRCPHAII